MKAQGDWMYAQGLNQFIFHRYALQPNLDAVPGMTMGCYGIHFDRTNTWFERAGEWIRYLSRCQYLLQQGLFVADIVYFEGENAPVEAPTLAVLEPAPPQGHDWDAIDAGAILTRARIDNGRIVLPDGMSYRLLVLRDDTRVTLNLMRKIRDLVRQGMCLVGARPQGSPSLVGYPESDSEVRRIVDELWGDTEGAALIERKGGQWPRFLGAAAERGVGETGSRARFRSDVPLGRRSGLLYPPPNCGRRFLLCVQPQAAAGGPGLHLSRRWQTARVLGPSHRVCHAGRPLRRRVRAGACTDPHRAGGLAVRGLRSPARAQRLVAVARDGATIMSPQPFAAPQPAPHREVANSFTVCVWIKPELDTPLPATGRGPLAAPASFVFFPPQGDAVYGEGMFHAG